MQSLDKQAASSELGKSKASLRFGFLRADTAKPGNYKWASLSFSLLELPPQYHHTLLFSTTISQARGRVFLVPYLQLTPLNTTSGSSSPQGTMFNPCPTLWLPWPAHLVPAFTADLGHACPAVDSVEGPPLTSSVHPSPASFAVDGCRQPPSEDCS